MILFEPTLAELLNRDARSFESQRVEPWHIFSKGIDKKIVIFGAGELGVRLLRILRQAGYAPLAFIDNDSKFRGALLLNIPVLTPQVAAQQLGVEMLVILAVYNTSKPREQLLSFGYARVMHFAMVFAGLSDHALPFFCLDRNLLMLQNKSRIQAALSLMADEESQRQFIAQIRHRLFLDFDCVKRPQTVEMRTTEYFVSSIYTCIDSEVLVDCGAYCGDTIERFLDFSGSKFKKIYAFEPDEKNFSALAKYVEKLPFEISSCINLLNKGVGKEASTLGFHAHGSVTSVSAAEGQSLVSIVRIDDATKDEPPTLIKMDIEGGEIEALRGCERTIRAHRPILAICVYHASEHLWEIPLLIQELCPTYKIFLRAHAEDCWDTTCYAIPPERLVN